MRARYLMVAILSLTGCVHALPPEVTCPPVVQAEAWVNRMPGPQPPDTSLIVTARIDAQELWMLKAMTQEAAPRILQLELLPGGSGYLGNTGFRSTKAGHPERIEIFCSGKLHHTISHVMTVM
ncbi:MAG: hypothetical protein CVT79_10585 [Alphaproteobacteria bacterium HGW-Alphaproteobacteria-18]|nr:MAG: hypothetical protein CVT79_10585 [Alphaproteobacteria bacterium HGW-Alphaproteobacteria-18]